MFLHSYKCSDHPINKTANRSMFNQKNVRFDVNMCKINKYIYIYVETRIYIYMHIYIYKNIVDMYTCTCTHVRYNIEM